MLTNRKEAYDEEHVVGVAIREDDMPVGVVLQVTVGEEGSADNFTRLTNCTLPQQGQWLVICVHVCGAQSYSVHVYKQCEVHFFLILSLYL